MNVSELSEQIEATLVLYRGAVTRMQAVILIAAERDSAPLDLHVPRDAAVLLRAEELALAETRVRAAIAHARDELQRSNGAVSQDTSPNGGPHSFFNLALPPLPKRDLCTQLEHTKIWGARDGVWRCASCEPPCFTGEVVAQTEVER